VKNRKPLNPAVAIALVLLGVIVVGLSGYMLLIRPQGAQLKQIKADEAMQQQTLDAYNQKVAAARSAPKIRVALRSTASVCSSSPPMNAWWKFIAAGALQKLFINSSSSRYA